MQEILKIQRTRIADELVQTVNARDLHKFLAVGKDFSTWVKVQIDRVDLGENIDYLCVPQKGDGVVRGFQPIDYFVTLDAGKNIAMMSQCAKGKEVRAYFIECEKQAKQKQAALPATKLEWMKLAVELEEKDIANKLKIEQDRPKVEFALSVRNMDGTCCVGDFAKALGIGRNNFFKWMRDNSFLMAGNIPYQRYSSLFSVVEDTPYTDKNGNTQPVFTTRITGKGQVFLEKKFRLMA